MGEGKVAIFLGAGFSSEADLPVMSDFGRYSREQLNTMTQKHGHSSRSPRDAAPLLIRNGKLYEEFCNFLQTYSSKNLVSFSVNNMEDIFTIAEMMAVCGFKNICLNKKHNKTLDEILEAIKLWLWKIYQRIPLHNPQRYGVNIKPYETFVEILEKFGLGNVSLITTNYDMNLEYLFLQKGIQVCYPISAENFDFYDLCPQAPRIAVSTPIKPDEGIPCLCKLHGSVNYFIRGSSSSKIMSDRESTDKNLNGTTGLKIVADVAKCSIRKSTIPSNAPSIMAVDAIYVLREVENLIPAIIPPTYAKLRDYPWIRDIWRQAADSLIAAEKWIFIGYSFPSSDGFMKSLISLALINKKHGNPEIFVIDPDDSGRTAANYANVFGGINICFIKMKFSEFIKSECFDQVIKK